MKKFSDHTIVIGGDFNLPGIERDSHSIRTGAKDRDSCDIILTAMSENYFEQIVREPTREANVLDLIATNRPELSDSVNVEEGISDHKSVIVSMNTGVKRNAKKGRKIYLLNKSDRVQIADLCKWPTSNVHF